MGGDGVTATLVFETAGGIVAERAAPMPRPAADDVLRFSANGPTPAGLLDKVIQLTDNRIIVGVTNRTSATVVFDAPGDPKHYLLAPGSAAVVYAHWPSDGGALEVQPPSEVGLLSAPPTVHELLLAASVDGGAIIDVVACDVPGLVIPSNCDGGYVRHTFCHVP